MEHTVRQVDSRFRVGTWGQTGAERWTRLTRREWGSLFHNWEAVCRKERLVILLWRYRIVYTESGMQLFRQCYAPLAVGSSRFTDVRLADSDTWRRGRLRSWPGSRSSCGHGVLLRRMPGIRGTRRFPFMPAIVSCPTPTMLWLNTAGTRQYLELRT